MDRLFARALHRRAPQHPAAGQLGRMSVGDLGLSGRCSRLRARAHPHRGRRQRPMPLSGAGATTPPRRGVRTSQPPTPTAAAVLRRSVIRKRYANLATLLQNAADGQLARGRARRPGAMPKRNATRRNLAHATTCPSAASPWSRRPRALAKGQSISRFVESGGLCEVANVKPTACADSQRDLA